MTQDEIFEQVVKILTPYVKNQEALDGVAMSTHILDELKVNSARLVDVVLEFEDAFDIEIADEDVDSVETVGNAVELIASKLGVTVAATGLPQRARLALALQRAVSFALSPLTTFAGAAAAARLAAPALRGHRRAAARASGASGAPATRPCSCAATTSR